MLAPRPLERETSLPGVLYEGLSGPGLSTDDSSRAVGVRATRVAAFSAMLGGVGIAGE
jgi:hypothetical protein